MVTSLYRKIVNLQITALTAVNLNQRYLDCVPLFIEYWTSFESSDKAIQYIPKVLVLAGELPQELTPYAEWCELLELDNRISSTFGSQAVRIFQPALEESEFVITTDVDMLPLDDRVFMAGVRELVNGSDFVICRDVLADGQYPICYNIASPKTWAMVTGVSSPTDLGKKLLTLFEGVVLDDSYQGEHGGVGWFADQEAIYSMVGEFEGQGGVVTKLKDNQTGHRRLDRFFMPFPINWLFVGAVSRGIFTDYHVHHPVKKHQRFIKQVMRSRGKKLKLRS